MCEHIFQLIRSGETVLFIGSGCSIEAGFPSGAELNKILYDKLMPSEQKRTSSSIPLPDMASFFVKVRSRQELISIITEVFSRKAEPSPFHELLASIPCWKDIITTNYDSLIETYLGQDKCDVIRCNADCAYMVSSKKHLLKIHGDITHKDDIVLTREDYHANKFQSGSKNDVLWGVTQTLMATRHIIFMGYGIGDPNINDILERIENSLGKNKRKMYLVAPGWEEEDIKDLYRREVDYINMSGTEFLELLNKNIEEHVLEDLENGRAEDATTIFHRHKLNPIVSYTGNKARLESIRPMDGTPLSVDGSITFDSLDVLLNRNSYITEFNPPPIEVSPSNIKELNLNINGLSFKDHFRDKGVKIYTKPHISRKFDVFFENGFTYNGLPVNVFVNGMNISLVFDLSILEGSFLITDIGDKIEFSFNYKLKKKCPNVFKALHELDFLVNLLIGNPFIVDNNRIDIDSKGKLPIEIKNIQDYYKRLLEIQSFFHFSFSNFDNVDDELFNKVNSIYSFIKQTGFMLESEGSFVLSRVERSLSELKEYAVLYKASQEEIIIDLFGKQISIGYRYVIYPNLKPVSSKVINGGIELEVTNKKYFEFYSDLQTDLKYNECYIIDNKATGNLKLSKFISKMKEEIQTNNSAPVP